MAILGTLGPDGAARAITLGDQRAIQAAPGVGPKLAQRVILELKAKAGGLMAQGASLAVMATADDDVLEPVAVLPTKPVRNAGAIAPAAPSASQVRAGHAADALSALTNLGYAQGEAAQAVATVASEAPASDTATLIRAALKLLAPKAK
jgi:Holliday junction DNA helicase RuvA